MYLKHVTETSPITENKKNSGRQRHALTNVTETLLKIKHETNLSGRITALFEHCFPLFD